MRVYEVARELDIEPPQLLQLLREMGSTARTEASSIDDTTVAKLRARLEREDFLRIEGIDGEAADALVGIIEELTVVEDAGGSETPAGQPTEAELAEAREVAAEILGLEPGGKSLADDRG